MVYCDNNNLYHRSWLFRLAKNCTRLSFSRTTQFYNFVHLFLRRGSNVDGHRPKWTVQGDKTVRSEGMKVEVMYETRRSKVLDGLPEFTVHISKN